MKISNTVLVKVFKTGHLAPLTGQVMKRDVFNRSLNKQVSPKIRKPFLQLRYPDNFRLIKASIRNPKQILCNLYWLGRGRLDPNYLHSGSMNIHPWQHKSVPVVPTAGHWNLMLVDCHQHKG